MIQTRIVAGSFVLASFLSAVTTIPAQQFQLTPPRSVFEEQDEPVRGDAVIATISDGSIRPARLHADAAVSPASCTSGARGWLDGLCENGPALDCLKGRKSCWNDDLTYSIGGEIRYRYMDERNRLRPMGALRRDTYDLWRVTPFMELKYRDWITGYVQAIDASIFENDISRLPIDENRADLLQYYVDLNLFDSGHGDLHYRYGRQFLKYGGQHLVSPLGWANTYRNFQGHRFYLTGDAWSVDAFAVQPVNGAAVATQFRPTSRDVTDNSFWFSGVYATYHQAPNGVFDLYWLWIDESQPVANLHDGRRHTIGARYAGARPVKQGDSTRYTWLWDFEGAYQFGEDNFVNGGGNLDVSAGFVSAISGVTVNQLPWSPTVKGLFWWGSGDDDPTDGNVNTVTTLFPLGHAWWGLIDNFNGANLLDYSVQASVQPHEKLNLAAHWHWFDKASSNDNIYNIAGVPLGNTTTSDRHIGNELDLLATCKVNSNLSVQAGYFWFWYGGAVDNNAGIAARDDAQQFYLMGTWGF